MLRLSAARQGNSIRANYPNVNKKFLRRVSMRPTCRLFLLAATSSFAFAAVPAAAQIPAAQLVKEVTIPHSTFKLKNGLTVIVAEDHKAPIVAVNVWYNIGSKDEPKGKTGFAHLYEHLMFNGSENMPGDYFKYLQNIGATDYNGTTAFDRTNYFQTVPKGALERALFMESDRMGWMLGAITQDVLDNQRSVVQNEKRQGDSRPGGLVFYEILANLYPEGHPYHHLPIGSMADLDKASLDDVKNWFRQNYGPNNAVLVIAGDVTAAEAKPLVERYFGAIPAGPKHVPAMANIPSLAAPKTIVMKDNVAATSIQRLWAVPGMLDAQLSALDIGSSVLGGLASSRLDEKLVRDERVAVSVSAGMYDFHRAGIIAVSATVKPGVDPALVSKRLDEVMGDFIANGPTKAEVERAVMSKVAGDIRGLEQVGGFDGKAQILNEGQTLAGDSDFYKKSLATYAAITPQAVKKAMAKWLTRPPLTIVLEPGERPAYEDAKSVEPPAKVERAELAPTRTAPGVSDDVKLDFPKIVHTRLSNGIAVDFAQRGSIPITQVAMSFDAGNAADPVAARGLSDMTMNLLDEGTSTMTSQQFAEAKEVLGAEISTGNSADNSVIYLSALTPNLAPSLSLMSAVARDPAFQEGDIERLKAQTLTGIAQMIKDPTQAGSRILPSVLYGPHHPYGGAPGGDPAAIAGFSANDFRAFKAKWLRPDNVKLFVVSDQPQAVVMTQLNKAFGDWSAPAQSKGVKAFPALPARATAQKILLVDRKGAPQSTIYGVQLLPFDPKGDIVPLDAATDVVGGNFLSRINMDLREEKGWSYGVRANLSLQEKAVPYIVSAPVQADRTGDALAALNQQFGDFLSNKGVNEEELGRTIVKKKKALPGQFETASSVLSAMIRIDQFDRPDDYYVKLPAEYDAMTATSLDQAARTMIDPKGFVWIVTGDAEKVRPQLDKLGLPIEVVEVK